MAGTKDGGNASVVTTYHDLQGMEPEEILSNSKICSLIEQTLRDEGADVADVISVLKSLEKCLNLFNPEHKSLVKAILNTKWLDKGPELVNVFQSFVLNFLSAHTNYFKPLLVILIKKMVTECHFSAETSEEEKRNVRLKMEQDFDNVHNLLKSLSRLIPMTTDVMMQIIEEIFPYINKGVSIFENYTRNILKITSYIPALRKEILDMLVKNMLKLDVRISRQTLSDIKAEEEEEVEDEEQDIFSMEMECEEEECAAAESTERVVQSAKEDRLAQLLPAAACLDAMMVVVIKFIKDTCFPGGHFDWTKTKILHRELLSSFDRYVFHTYLSNHTQFIMFYICSFKEPLVDGFIDYLWKKVTNPMSQPIYRQIAACYIGSLIARANYISLSTAKTVMKLMMQFIHNYLDQSCDTMNKADVTHHAAFYSVCQACFYIFCFKHTQFIQDKKGYKWLEALNFQHVITSKLNPLKFCLPIVVKTFSSASRTHQLAFCDTIIERNNRWSLPVSSSKMVISADTKLHYFFPFDPYLLKQSSSLITPLYKEYQGSIPDDDIIDDEEEDDFLPEDDIHSNTSDPLSILLDTKSRDLLQYSISPGFKHADLL